MNCRRLIGCKNCRPEGRYFFSCNVALFAICQFRVRHYRRISFQQRDILTFSVTGQATFAAKAFFIEYFVGNHRRCAVEGTAGIVLIERSVALIFFRLHVGKRSLGAAKNARFNGDGKYLRWTAGKLRQGLPFCPQAFANYCNSYQEQKRDEGDDGDAPLHMIEARDTLGTGICLSPLHFYGALLVIRLL